jgi:hypothetical protein
MRSLHLFKAVIYPFVAVNVALEMAIAEGRAEVSKALHELVADTLSDAREINELKAEIAVLRAEINEVKYRGTKSGRGAKVSVP